MRCLLCVYVCVCVCVFQLIQSIDLLQTSLQSLEALKTATHSSHSKSPSKSMDPQGFSQDNSKRRCVCVVLRSKQSCGFLDHIKGNLQEKGEPC